MRVATIAIDHIGYVCRYASVDLPRPSADIQAGTPDDSNEADFGHLQLHRMQPQTTHSGPSRSVGEGSLCAKKPPTIAPRWLSFTALRRPRTVKFSDAVLTRPLIEGFRRHAAISGGARHW